MLEEELLSLKLRDDCINVKVNVIGKDTFINYYSESHPNKNCIRVVQGIWELDHITNGIIYLK